MRVHVCTIVSITAVAEFEISPRTCADLVCQTIALLQFLWAFWKCLTTTLSVSRNPHIKRQIVARHELNYNNNNKRKNKTKMAVSCAQRDQKYKNNTKSATNVEIFCVKFNLTYKLMQWCATKRATWKCVWPKQNVEPNWICNPSIYCRVVVVIVGTSAVVVHLIGVAAVVVGILFFSMLRCLSFCALKSCCGHCTKPGRQQARQLIWSKWIKYNGNEH